MNDGEDEYDKAVFAEAVKGVSFAGQALEGVAKNHGDPGNPAALRAAALFYASRMLATVSARRPDAEPLIVRAQYALLQASQAALAQADAESGKAPDEPEPTAKA